MTEDERLEWEAKKYSRPVEVFALSSGRFVIAELDRTPLIICEGWELDAHIRVYCARPPAPYHPPSTIRGLDLTDDEELPRLHI